MNPLNRAALKQEQNLRQWNSFNGITYFLRIETACPDVFLLRGVHCISMCVNVYQCLTFKNEQALGSTF